VIDNRSLIGYNVRMQTDEGTERADDPRARRRQATMQRILAAAWELAEEQGLAGISLRDLAAKVDLRQPSLYSYFDSKHALYDAMFAQGCEQMREARAAIRFSGDPVKAVKEMARGFVQFAVENPARAQLMFLRTIPGFEPSPASYALAEEVLGTAREVLAAAGLTTQRHLDMYTALTSGIVNQQMANDPGGTRWTKLTDELMDMYIEHTLDNLDGSLRSRRGGGTAASEARRGSDGKGKR
jgi:AcrR family transcriptional regulator